MIRIKVGLGATVAPVQRATSYQPMLEFIEQEMTRRLGRPVRLDLMISKEARRDQQMIQKDLDLTRIGALPFFRARESNPGLVLLVQENSPKDSVIFTLTCTGITNLSQLRGRSIAFADTNSTIDAWAKVHLLRAGLRASDFISCAHLQSTPEEKDIDYHAHKEALEAVKAGMTDAGVARPLHIIDALGPEGSNWVSLLKFESSQTLWVGGSRLAPEVREALRQAMLALAGLGPKEQQDLKLPDRVRNLTPINAKSLRELQDALERDLREFDRPAGTNAPPKQP